ncbi:hypothetical protein BD413DRAFT_604998 [Trametes elegans]|nr:hypothetical protein BD413DRAFT_604998 [Trametes elegans]
MNSGSPYIIQVIQEIKDSVEKPHRCGWLENMRSDEAKRARMRRYRDGAVKIMDLLRADLSSADIGAYEVHYDRLRDTPKNWYSERLSLAKKLWEYVLSLDERLSHNRVTSLPGAPAHMARPYRVY